MDIKELQKLNEYFYPFDKTLNYMIFFSSIGPTRTRRTSKKYAGERYKYVLKPVQLNTKSRKNRKKYHKQVRIPY